MSVFHSHLQLKPVSVVCWVQPPPDTKYSGLNYKNREEMKVYLNIILIIDYKMSFNCYFCFIYIYIYMTYLMARHTSLWISDPIWSTGAMSSCHSSRPERRTLSLFCSDWGLKNLNTTWRGPTKKKKKTLKKTQKVAESFWAKPCPAAP